MNISTFQNNLDFIKSLYFYEEWKDEDCKKEILEALEEANEKILDAFGKSLHKLHKHKPSVAAVEKVVKKFPSTLFYKEKYIRPTKNIDSSKKNSRNKLAIHIHIAIKFSFF